MGISSFVDTYYPCSTILCNTLIFMYITIYPISTDKAIIFMIILSNKVLFGIRKSSSMHVVLKIPVYSNFIADFFKNREEMGS